MKGEDIGGRVIFYRVERMDGEGNNEGGGKKGLAVIC